MEATEIKKSLDNLYNNENHRIIFWQDEQKEFEDNLEDYVPDDVKLIRADQTPSLKIKVTLEIEDLTSKYLVYEPYASQDPENDWLINIRLYSRPFYADKASILLHELGLDHTPSLKTHLMERKAFFKSQDRTEKLVKWIHADDTAEDIDRKMIAVLVKAKEHYIHDIIFQLAKSGLDDEQLKFLEKFSVLDAFWNETARNYNYDDEDKNLLSFFIHLFVTDFLVTSKAKENTPPALKKFLLTGHGEKNVPVLLSRWHNHMEYYQCFNEISGLIAKEVRIEDHLSGFSLSALSDVLTFEQLEKYIICELVKSMGDFDNFSYDDFSAIITKRKDGHFAKESIAHLKSDTTNYYNLCYEALDNAAELLTLKAEHGAGISFKDAKEAYNSYTDKLYRFDQLYRLFTERADRVDTQGSDLLKQTREQVENCYGWYLDQISNAWGEHVSASLLESWQIDKVPNQYNFFKEFVKSKWNGGTKPRIFVIISDALRYEVAHEINEELNGKYRVKAELSSQLGVLPSYTTLGMAALLPHESLTYKENGNVIVDGIDSVSENRKKILAKVNGTAIKATEVFDLSQEAGREKFKGLDVIYVYHNQIDAIGDSGSTELGAFEAARDAVNEVAKLTKRIIDNYQGNHVIITADHGFLYNKVKPDEIDRTKISSGKAKTYKQKKRYIVGTGFEESSNVWLGKTSVTAKTDDDTEFQIPKGTNRFHFSGGARFIHGGAMLQEIVVPVIQVKHIKGKAVETTRVDNVDVQILGNVSRIVNNMQKFEFIQAQSVSERCKPRTLNIGLYDDNILISNEETITFDSADETLDKRKKNITLTLMTGDYDRNKAYYLVLTNTDSKTEYSRTKLKIDLAYSNEF